MNMRDIAVSIVALGLLAGCAGESSNAKKKELQLDQLPVTVKRGIEVAYPDAQVTQIVKDTDKSTGVVQYRVQLTDKDGVKHSDSFAADGTPASVKQEYKPYTKASQ